MTRPVGIPVPYTNYIFVIEMPENAPDDSLTQEQTIILALHKRIQELAAEIERMIER